MPPRSLPPAGSYPNSASCPTSCRPRDAGGRRLASAPTSHRGMLPRLGFVVVPHAGCVPAGYSFADFASAHAERGNSEGNHPYVFLDGLWLKRSWGGEVRNVSLLVAIGVNDEGFREVLAVAEGAKEDKASWTAFLRHLKERGLKGVRLFVSDKCLGLVESLGEFYPEALWQRCAVHFYRHVWTAVPTSKVKENAAMLKAIHAQEDRASARQKAEQVVAKLKEMKLADAAEWVRGGIEGTLFYYLFSREQWRSLRTNNPLDRIRRELRRRPRTVGAFPDGKSALMLAAARLRYVAGTKWGTRRYLDMNRLAEASEAA
jgi:putative transposase